MSASYGNSCENLRLRPPFGNVFAEGRHNHSGGPSLRHEAALKFWGKYRGYSGIPQLAAPRIPLAGETSGSTVSRSRSGDRSVELHRGIIAGYRWLEWVACWFMAWCAERLRRRAAVLQHRSGNVRTEI